MTTTEPGHVHDQDALDDLPVGSIIRTATARVACKSWQEPDEPGDWYETGRESEVTSAAFDDFPIMVVYRGGTAVI